MTEAFLLPADVVSTAAASLPEEERRRLDAEEDDFVLTRLHGRGHSKVVDSGMARLVEHFREATPIVDAVLAFSRTNGTDPEATLEAAYPILQRLIRARLLVPKGSDEAAPVESSLRAGDSCDGLTVARLVQLLEDSEIYQARTADGRPAALKIARAASAERLAAAIAREAAILALLDGSVAPRLLRHGAHGGRPFLATEWVEGAAVAHFTARLRVTGEAGRRELRDLCAAIAEAYAELHARGVLHGDVHPGNLIVESEQSVKLIDFGYARAPGSAEERLSKARRVGVGHFFEPEYARAQLDGAAPPQASFAGEQHIVAHLLYRLAAGRGFADFAAEFKTGMRQLAASEPEPFERWGVEPWPEFESALSRALSPDPAARFASMAEFAGALRGAAIPAAKSRTTASAAGSERLLDDYLRRFDPEQPLFAAELPEAPHCSIYYGAGGVAYFLYRLAIVREDARLLSHAKLWIEKAVADARRLGERAFYLPGGPIPYDVLGPMALYHTMTGLRFVQTLIARAQGDLAGQMDGVATFAEAVRVPWDNLDLTLGRSGALLGCALLREALPDHDALLATGDFLRDEIWRELDAKPEIQSERKFRFTGIAHGWAGAIYAALAWSRATGRPTPGTIGDRLEQLARLAEPAGAGVRWQRLAPVDGHRAVGDYWPSWCNGTAGMVFLWTLAHELLGDPRSLELAEGAARHVAEQTEPVNQICCGRPGQTYAILNLYKHTGERRWLDVARRMAAESLSLGGPAGEGKLPEFYYALFKGPMGTALLSAEMATPDRAAMPVFESEGWGG